MKTFCFSFWMCVLAAGAWAQTQTVATRALLAAPVNFATGDEPSAVAVGDFNRDGALDFVVANRARNSITVFRGNGAGGFAADAPIAVPAGPEALAVADYNGDGRLDLVVACSGANQIILFNGANTAALFAGNSILPVGTSPGGVAWADVNRDGRPDLVVTNAGSANVTLLAQNSGGGGWQAPVTFTIGAGTTPRSPVPPTRSRRSSRASSTAGPMPRRAKSSAPECSAAHLQSPAHPFARLRDEHQPAGQYAGSLSPRRGSRPAPARRATAAPNAP